MKYFFYFICFFFVGNLLAQDDLPNVEKDTIKRSLREGPKQNPKAPHNWYRIYTLQRDTVYVDTSLTIKSEYKFNYLRKDNFGLLPFANDGQTYNKLFFGLRNQEALPAFGFWAKRNNYLDSNDINYYSVATPLTELYFKTVLEQGQSLDAFITLNTSKNFNISVAYKGLRSLGKYINSLSSTGNFRFTSSYKSTNNRYILNSHITAQDISNQENGGILEKEKFESGDSQFSQRARIDVAMEDAKSTFEGKRIFVDHSFRINKNENANNAILDHQFRYETMFFGFVKSAKTTLFGDGYLDLNYDDLVKTNMLYNKLGATFHNKIIGKFNVFVEDFNYNYFYNRYTISSGQVTVPNSNNNRLDAIGGKYFYESKRIKGIALLSKGISKQTFSTLDISATYEFDKENSFTAQFLNLSKVPDMNYTLYQSDFINYNWYNSFENEKINTLKASAKTKWINADFELTNLNDHLYFSNDDSTEEKLLITPKQYSGNIQYLAVKGEKEIKFGKFALDNTFLFQQVIQNDPIINVPKIVTRNTLYFTDYFFNKALFLQTGVTFQYFTKYYGNNYNPLIGEFFTQNKDQIGGYPLFDFFVNARVKQTRIFLKAEHFNSGLTGNNYYSAPNYPYKDFIIRFGLVWNFFQ